ncbi:MAG: glycosyltransferase family 39 protein [Lachnospiraceae bacterium]|nr:glycosyltransferase family 39 protein [Lachnospiraceae bacterium]
MTYFSRRQYGLTMLIIFAVLIMLTVIVRRKRSIYAKASMFTVLWAVFLRLLYVYYTPTYIRQHDVIGFGNDEGQAAFIEWFVTHAYLPDFNPREKWGFFQPPLHHILAALWIKLNMVFGVAYNKACENVQLLTLIYSIVFTVYAIRLFRRFRMEEKEFFIALAITAMHPIYILLSGSVNNDMLCILLTLMTVYYGLVWYKSDSLADIIKLAFCMGLSMMAKLSGVLTVPALLFLFISRLVSGGKKKAGHFIREYVIFGIISIPIGLFSPIRNFIRFGVPLTYTPSVKESLEGYSILQRFTDIFNDNPFTNLIKYGDPFDEYCIPLALMKTSLTGEFNFALETDYVTPFARVLLISGSLLAIIGVLCTVLAVFGKSYIKDKTERVYLGLVYIAAIVFYVNLCLKTPNFSSQDFRYIAYIVAIEALFIGVVLRYNNQNHKHKVFGMFILTTTVVFCVCTSAVYLLLGMP